MSLIDVNDRIVFIKIRHREIKMRMSIIMIVICFFLPLIQLLYRKNHRKPNLFVTICYPAV